MSLILAEYDILAEYTGLLSLILAEYAASQKCSAVLLCSADSIYPVEMMKSECCGEAEL